MKLPIYMDYHATTPVDPRVVQAMLPFFTEHFGNPASRNHAFGWEAEEAVDEARKHVADLIGASAKEVIFTSGATEANNLAIKGVAEMYREKGNHIITCVTEHKAVIDTCKRLEKNGYRVTYLPVQKSGLISLDELKAAITDKTILITIMAANNEIGVVQPIAVLSRIGAEAGAAFHCDAAQSAGVLPLDVTALGVEFLSLSAHKLYGPKGIGALVVRRHAPRARIEPILHGGGHERGLRSGTLPVPLCVGFGVAAELARVARDADAEHHTRLRERLFVRLSSALPALVLNGPAVDRLPGNLNLAFLGVEGEALLAGLPELALSAGSACTSAKREPSHVLKALGAGENRALSSLRFGIGRGNDEAQIDAAAELVIAQVRRLRALSPVWDDLRRAGARA
jgi:cysteine desulfurase